MDGLAHRPATALLRALDDREISSRELLEHFLGRVEQLNPRLNAVVTLDAERALKRADEADAARAQGEAWGPLHGLPITVKDCFETEGLRTTCGAEQYADHVPGTDAVAVARLRRAGAVTAVSSLIHGRAATAAPSAPSSVMPGGAPDNWTRRFRGPIGTSLPQKKRSSLNEHLMKSGRNSSKRTPVSGCVACRGACGWRVCVRDPVSIAIPGPSLPR